MFGNARRSVREQVARNGHLSYEVLRDLSIELPGNYTARQLHTQLAGSNEIYIGEPLESLIIFERCLQHSENLVRENGDDEHVKSLSLWISVLIKPTGDVFCQDDSAEDEKEAPEAAQERTLLISQLGIEAISKLLHMFQIKESDVELDVLLSLVSFTNARDPWTSNPAHIIATKILHDHAKRVQTEEFIIEFILKGFVRPLFTNSRPTTVTAGGRKAINPDNVRSQIDLDPSVRPWKFQQISAVTILGWVVSQSDEIMIYKSWHLFIPPILTLLDDVSTPVRIRGLEISKILLEKITAKVLKQTGLGEVFEDAIMPTLLFLPSLTPVDESVRLLKPAYEVLFTLANARFPVSEDWPQKMRFMDRILRQGILHGIEHCRDNVKIIDVLLKELRDLISRMGIHSVKHLKDILPILSAILSDPFGPARPDSLILAAKATQTTILNCWPRMGELVHRLEIVRALCLCWANITEDIGQHNVGLDLVKHELKIAGVLLVKSTESTIHISDEISPLLVVDGTLRELFGLQKAA